MHERIRLAMAWSFITTFAIVAVILLSTVIVFAILRFPCIGGIITAMHVLFFIVYYVMDPR